MGTGTLMFEISKAQGAYPVEGAKISLFDSKGEQFDTLITNEDGKTKVIEISAPDKQETYNPNDTAPYSTVDANIEKEGFYPVYISGIQIFDGEKSIQQVDMTPAVNSLGRSTGARVYNIDDNSLLNPAERIQTPENPRESRILQDVIIPEYITVHLGAPNQAARNIKVKFTDYIKNVASSEIYPTWPKEALEANILAIISFTLNRIYTEWYRSRGYDFDITNSTAYDQHFVEGRNNFESISLIVDDIFNDYIRRIGNKSPLLAKYCDGDKVQCDGLSQWGSMYLADSGLDAFEILQRYYSNNIEIATTNHLEALSESYPGYILSSGSRNAYVQNMQNYLNRISVNYPGIPKINNPNGYFGNDTEEAVKAFQQIFNLEPDGVIGRSTWYKISYIYSAVTQLAELNTEGDVTVSKNPPDITLRRGNTGDYVSMLQLMLNYVAEFFPDMPFISIDGQFGPATENAVKTFQRLNGLTADGIVGKNTWNSLFNVYYSLQNGQANYPAYPGTLLREGSKGESVRLMQNYLRAISSANSQIPLITADGAFGPKTTEAVKAFQRNYGLTPDGIIGPATWNRIVEEYNNTRKSLTRKFSVEAKKERELKGALSEEESFFAGIRESIRKETVKSAENNQQKTVPANNMAQNLSGVILSRMLFRR